MENKTGEREISVAWLLFQHPENRMCVKTITFRWKNDECIKWT